MIVRPLLVRVFFLGLQTEYFFSKVEYASQNQEIELVLLGTSLITPGEVPRSVYRFSRVAVLD